MIHEDLTNFKDGTELNEDDIATVITHFESLTIFQDNGGNIYYCQAEPAAFEIGTIAPTNELISIENADEELQVKVFAAVEGR